jgi:hypothetical protein
MDWSEYSFILKPSPLAGVGVFATHDITAGSPIFDHTRPSTSRVLKSKDLPEAMRHYVIYLNDEECLAPERFDRMEIGWYLNHSTEPNIEKRSVGSEGSVLDRPRFFAIKDIKAGDEIVINYNHLNEPEHLKENYYRKL